MSLIVKILCLGCFAGSVLISEGNESLVERKAGGVDPVCSDPVLLSPDKPRYSIEFAVDGSEERIYGIEYEFRGEPGGRMKIDLVSTIDESGKVTEHLDVADRHWQLPVLDGWEGKGFEFLTRKDDVWIRIEFVMDGNQPVELRHVRAVEGGLPGGGVIPEAPDLDWIDSLRPNLENAEDSPLLTLSPGGGDVWNYKRNDFWISPKRARELAARVEPYMAMTVPEIVDLVPTKRPFRIGGYLESPFYYWKPETPKVIYDKKTGKVFDYRSLYPIEGYEEVIAPSGKVVSYAYHQTDESDERYRGQRLYVDQFQSDTRLHALLHAGYNMAAVFRQGGDPEYGVRSAAILWAVARNMPDWPSWGTPFWNSPYSDRRLQDPDFYCWFTFVMGGQWYVTDAGVLVWPARYFDLIRDFPEVWKALAEEVDEPNPRMETASGLLHMAKMALKRDANYRSNAFVFHHNLSGTVNRSLIQIGRVVGEPELVHYGLRKVEGAFRERFMADGVFPESYWYTLDQFNRQSQALDMLEGYSDPEGYVADLDGTRLIVGDPRESVPTYDRILQALQHQAYPDGTAHTVHDSWSQTANPVDSRTLDQRSRDEVEPYLFPAYGHGILGRGVAPNRIESHLHYSGYYNHGHRDMLNLILWANGDELVSDIGYSHITQYNGSTLSHNLVVVDRSVQATGMHAGNLLAWYARKGATQVIQADQGPIPAYSQCSIYRRALLLLPFDEGRTAVLDLFEVEGGSRHDWMANGSADYDAVVTSSLKSAQVLDNLALDGIPVEDPLPWGADSKARYTQEKVGEPSLFYGSFRNAKIAEMEKAWWVRMSPGAPVSPETPWAGDRAKSSLPKSSLQLNWMEPLDGKAIIAEAPRNRYKNELHHKKEASEVWSDLRMPKIIVSREGEELKSLFAGVWEPFYDRPFLTQVVRISELQGEGHGWVLEDSHIRKTVLYRPLENGGELRADGLAGDGRFLIESVKGSRFDLDLFEGSWIENGRLRAELKPGEERLLIRTESSADSYAFWVEGTAEEISPGGFIYVVQEGESNRWLQLDSIESSGGNTKLILADDPGFEFDSQSRILKETYFPHRKTSGLLTVRIPSWLNLQADLEKQWLRIRGRGAVTLRLNGFGQEVNSVQIKQHGLESLPTSLDFRYEEDGIIISIPAEKMSENWRSIEILRGPQL
ncbi:MAG: heparinase II/III domain-containing protein [Puniceicoccales bacterium]